VRAIDGHSNAQNYAHLVGVNEPSKGGSAYIKSKVEVAKKIIDEAIQAPKQ
jgi:hypothetical protein